MSAGRSAASGADSGDSIIVSREKPAFPLGRGERLLALLNEVPLPRGDFLPREAILMTGTARSGTTWLGQVLGSLPGYALVTEPLNPKMPGRLRAGFSWATWQRPDEPWPAGARVFQRLARGRGVTIKLLHRNGLRVMGVRAVVIKAIRAQRLLPWLGNRWEGRTLIHLVRHPCAVVSSQMAHLPDRDPCWADNVAFVTRERPDLLPLLQNLRSEAQRRALTWAIDQYVPFAAAEPRWLTVAYEELVAGGEEALLNLCARLDVEPTAATRDVFLRNSWQVREHSVDHARASVERRLSVWRDRLPAAEISSILEVVRAVGVLGYDESVRPSAPFAVERPHGSP